MIGERKELDLNVWRAECEKKSAGFTGRVADRTSRRLNNIEIMKKGKRKRETRKKIARQRKEINFRARLRGEKNGFGGESVGEDRSLTWEREVIKSLEQGEKGIKEE